MHPQCLSFIKSIIYFLISNHQNNSLISWWRIYHTTTTSSALKRGQHDFHYLFPYPPSSNTKPYLKAMKPMALTDYCHPGTQLHWCHLFDICRDRKSRRQSNNTHHILIVRQAIRLRQFTMKGYHGYYLFHIILLNIWSVGHGEKFLDYLPFKVF